MYLNTALYRLYIPVGFDASDGVQARTVARSWQVLHFASAIVSMRSLPPVLKARLMLLGQCHTVKAEPRWRARPRNPDYTLHRRAITWHRGQWLVRSHIVLCSASFPRSWNKYIKFVKLVRTCRENNFLSVIWYDPHACVTNTHSYIYLYIWMYESICNVDASLFHGQSDQLLTHLPQHITVSWKITRSWWISYRLWDLIGSSILTEMILVPGVLTYFKCWRKGFRRARM